MCLLEEEEGGTIASMSGNIPMTIMLMTMAMTVIMAGVVYPKLLTRARAFTKCFSFPFSKTNYNMMTTIAPHRDTSPSGNLLKSCAFNECVCVCVFFCCLCVSVRHFLCDIWDGTSSFKVWSIQTATPPSPTWWVLSSSLCVAFHVQGQVVRPGKAPVAVSALERFRARVLPVVARELVAAREAPLAALPRALVRFFAWKGKKKKKIDWLELV